MCKIQSMYAAPFVHSPLLFTLSETHPSPGVYDEDGQWMVQVNRLQRLIDRLEKKVTSFISTFPFFSPSCLLLLLFSSASGIFIFVRLFTILTIWSLHRSLRLTTNYNDWTQNNINKLTQPNNTFLRTNTYTYVQYTGNAICMC